MAQAMFSVDWHDLRQVIMYAKPLGKGQLVVKHASRDNYNITHATRSDLWNKPTVTVMYRT